MKMSYGYAVVEIVTTSAGETKKAAAALAREIVRAPRGRGARVVALSGELGAGKTTFTQGFAAALRIKEKIKSPTFVLIKIYDLRQVTRDKRQGFKHLIHIDCYRIRGAKDFIHLGLKDMLRDRDAIIFIEWPERIKKILPRGAVRITFAHGFKQNERRIAIDSSGVALEN